MREFCRLRGSEGYEACIDVVGVDCGEGPPVPIPNTEVKLSSAEDSWLEAACENRKMPTSTSVYPIGQAFFFCQFYLSVNSTLLF